MTIKIALCGKIRSGKDTVADVLQDRYGFERFKFSQGIWDVLETAWNIKDEPNTEKPRKMLQDVGQKLREVDEMVWINYTLHQVAEIDGIRDVVITDLRQPNEYKALKDTGFYIVRINADTDERIARAKAQGDIFEAQDLFHETESHVDGFEVDFEINNDGTFQELNQQIDEVFQEIYKIENGFEGGSVDECSL